MSFDLKISWPEENRTVKLLLTEETLEFHGQHGKSIILTADNDEKWILKVFPNVIQDQEIDIYDIDLGDSPETVKHFLHLWRVLNEYVASQIAISLDLPVPEAIIVCSGEISKFKLEPDDGITLGEDEIILDEDQGQPETIDEFYRITDRDQYLIETSEKFEKFLSNVSSSGKSTDVLGILIKFIPNSQNLDQYMENNDFDTAVKSIQKLDAGYKLLPFDTWLNDPDRNQGNYILAKTSSGELETLYGIDYEMWSFGADNWMDEDKITKGRSYLTAIIHNNTTLFDPRILETIFGISSLSDDELEELTLAPNLVCKFIEFNITRGFLLIDERLKLLAIEENIWDFLSETRPRIETLTLRIIRQIGLPKHLKTLQEKLEKLEEEIYKDYDDFENYSDENEDEEDVEE